MSRQYSNRFFVPSNNSSNSPSHHHHQEQKRSRHNDNEREQQYRTHHYQPYPNPRPTQIQATNPTPRHVPSTSSNTRHRNEMTFEPTPHHSPLFHRTSMTSFLLTDLLHRITDAHASSYSDHHIHHHHHHPTTASIDLIAYAWMSPSQEIFSLPPVFSIQFSDFFDLIVSDETPVVGLTDSELDRIPTIIYKNNKKSDDRCAICLSEYINGEKLKHLKCKHDFHSECIDPWLKTSTRCPICRGIQTN